MLKKLGLVVGITSFLIACGPDCVSMCEKAQEDEKDCFLAPDGDPVDCEDYCEDVETIAEEDNGDCEDDLDELISCMGDSDNACDALTDDCENEYDDVRDCIGDFCFDTPNNDACENSFGI